MVGSLLLYGLIQAKKNQMIFSLNGNILSSKQFSLVKQF